MSKPGIMGHPCNLNTWKAATGELPLSLRTAQATYEVQPSLSYTANLPQKLYTNKGRGEGFYKAPYFIYIHFSILYFILKKVCLLCVNYFCSMCISWVGQSLPINVFYLTRCTFCGKYIRFSQFEEYYSLLLTVVTSIYLLNLIVLIRLKRQKLPSANMTLVTIILPSSSQDCLSSALQLTYSLHQAGVVSAVFYQENQ